jgi:hypothetical protein
MVVEYHTYSLGMPFIRGCFVAHDDVDDLLRQTEPPAHDKWHDAVGVDGINPLAPKVAKVVKNEIKEKVKDFKKRFTAPPPRAGELNLPILDELSRLMKGRKPTPPRQNPRAVRLNFLTAAHVVAAGSGMLACRSAVQISVDDWVWSMVGDVSEVEVTVLLAVAYLEDETIGERLKMSVTCSDDRFLQTSVDDGKYVWRGPLGPLDYVTFEIKTEPYSADWSVKFSPTADVTSPALGGRATTGRD